jgi:nicotinamidase/pyrazinamidase
MATDLSSRTVGEALLIIDFQNDFTPGGALAVQHGDEIAGRINELAASGRYDLVIATRDWHPENHNSFVAMGGPWPVHCVQDSPGAELHPALNQAAIHKIIDTGYRPDLEGYSAFEATELAELLHDRGITKVTVVGLATDYCVKHTALDALREGFEVEIDTEAMRGVNVEPGDDERAIEEMIAAGATPVPASRRR